MAARKTFVLLVLIVLSAFMGAYSAQAVDFNTTLTNTSFESGSIVFMNFTIGNQNTTYNITEINITLPSALTFIWDTNATTVYGNFSNTSTVISWSNTSYSGIVNFSTIEYFWINASISSVNNTEYNITVAVLDNELHMNITNITISIVDRTYPAITIESPTANSWHKQNFTINASIIDSGSGVNTSLVYYRFENKTWNGSWNSMTWVNSTLWNSTVGIQDTIDGYYNITINATDSAGNQIANITVSAVQLDDTVPVISSFTLVKADSISYGESLSTTDGDDFDCSCTDNSNSFGGSCAISLSTEGTSATGTKTATCFVTDDAGNNATSTVDYYVISGSSGGGTSSGGSGGSTSSVFSTISADTKISVKNIPEDTRLIEIAVVPLTTVSSVKFVVKTSSGSNDVEAPTDLLHNYFEIIAENLEEADIKSVELEFKVNISWIQDNDLNADEIILYRLKDSKWINLNTTHRISDNEFAFYVATTPGFSIFAIGAEHVVQEQPSTENQEQVEVSNVEDNELPPVNPIIENAMLIVVLVSVLGIVSYMLFEKFKVKTKRH